MAEAGRRPTRRPTGRQVENAGVTLKNLRTFFWLARHRNYHAVARQLNVTQPAVTSRIAMLEDELGVRLFSRDRNSVQLTPEGRDALRHCEEVLDGVDRLLNRFSGAMSPAGIVRMGVVDTVARTWLPKLLTQLQQESPNIDLEITNESTVVLHSLMRSGALSMCVSIVPCEHPDIGNAEIMRSGIEWVASPSLFDPGHAYTRQELSAMPMIGYLPSSPPALWLDRHFGDGAKPRMVHNTTNSMSTMIWLAENGLGIAAIPPQAVRQHIADGRLAIMRTEAPLEAMPFYLSHRVRPFSPVVETVRSLIAEVAGKGDLGGARP